MEIYLIRHGQAYSKAEDPERGLTPEGRNRIRFSGLALKNLQIKLDLIVTSLKKRAQQTAGIMAEVLDYPRDQIQVTEALNPDSPARDVLSYLLNYPDKDRILLAGHLPSLTLIAAEILHLEMSISLHFETGSIARIDSEELFAAPGGTLRWHLTPGQLMIIARDNPD